jgi:hypothetical protein
VKCSFPDVATWIDKHTIADEVYAWERYRAEQALSNLSSQIALDIEKRTPAEKIGAVLLVLLILYTISKGGRQLANSLIVDRYLNFLHDRGEIDDNFRRTWRERGR